MIEHPRVIVALLTYARTEYAVRTVESFRANVEYPNLGWYVADDGSDRAHVDAVLAALDGADVIGHHSERASYGTNATRAWYQAHQQADLTLFLEDDWEVRKPFSLVRYVQLLQDFDDVGMVRLAHLPVGLSTKTCGYSGSIYLRMLPGQQYAFSGNPSLRHRRAREAWGPYPEKMYPGETELAYDYQIQQRGGPSIIWPVDIGAWGLFGHIGTEKSYKMPGEA